MFLFQNINTHPNIVHSNFRNGCTCAQLNHNLANNHIPGINLPPNTAANSPIGQYLPTNSIKSKLPNASGLHNFNFGSTSFGLNNLGLSTSGSSSQSLPKIGVRNPVSYLGNEHNQGIFDTVDIAGSQFIDEDSPTVKCPNDMEIIGYVTFEGYLPVDGMVRVAENICDETK
jgi:hypothetical protein